MDWLERHLRGFVLPLLREYSKRMTLTSDGYQSLVTSHDFRFSPHLLATPVENLRPAKVARSCIAPKEFGLLKSAVKSFGLWETLGWNLRNMLNGENGYTPFALTRLTKTIDSSKSQLDHMHWYAKACTKAIRSRLKGTDKQVILLGRDVWSIAILCEKYGIPYVYDPVVSRMVADSNELDTLFSKWSMREGDILFDTGFAGSIHKRVTSASGIHLENLMMSAYDWKVQVFPNSGIARNYALAWEYVPKYFKTGTVVDGEITQFMARIDEFLMTALLTIIVWKHESPSVMVSDRMTSYRILQY